MQPSEALSASAQVAVTLAGFAGVVVAFRTGAVHEWSKMDKFRLEILLSNSVLPFILSIFGMVMVATSLNQPTIWRLCSLIGFVLIVIRSPFLARTYRAFSREELKSSGSRGGFLFRPRFWAFLRPYCRFTT